MVSLRRELSLKLADSQLLAVPPHGHLWVHSESE